MMLAKATAMSARIVVPLDGTPQADRALLYSETLVRGVGGQVKLIRVVESGSPTEYIERGLAAAARRLNATGVRAEWSVVEGEIVSAILGVAQTWRAEMIAVATKKSSGMDRWLADGIADAVLRSAEVPTLVVPPEWEHAQIGQAARANYGPSRRIPTG
jgi:nucleotide-binding universal stress UspA family protein